MNTVSNLPKFTQQNFLEIAGTAFKKIAETQEKVMTTFESMSKEQKISTIAITALTLLVAPFFSALAFTTGLLCPTKFSEGVTTLRDRCAQFLVEKELVLPENSKVAADVALTVSAFAVGCLFLGSGSLLAGAIAFGAGLNLSDSEQKKVEEEKKIPL